MRITGKRKEADQNVSIRTSIEKRRLKYPAWLKPENADWSRVGLIMAFLVPVCIMLVLFVMRGIFPFGDRSFLFSDMYHQYMPFFSEFMSKIKAGEGLSYSYHVGIGSNFLALYVYYLASPFHWLAFLFPKQYLMEFMSYLVVIKIGLCGLTACIYLRRRFATKEFAVLFFSCFYALSGFTAAYNWNIMWLDCVILLPLILLGLERLVKEGKCGLYCITLALSIFTNFYISIMICIFLVFYFLVLFLTGLHVRRLKALGNFALFSLLAGGMAAVLLVPEVCAILETDFGDMNFPDTLESYFSVLDMLARHCLGVTTERGLEHWPNIYCGGAVFMLLPIYALNQKIPMRRRFGYLALAGFMLVGFSTNMLDFIWHGMNYPDSLPARQSFIYILLILVMSYEAFREIGQIEKKQILYCYLGAVVFLLCCEKFIESEDFTIGIELLTLGFVTAYAVLLYLYRTRKSARWREGLAFAAFVVVVAETGINTYNTSIGTTSRSQYLGQQEDYKALVEQAAELEYLKSTEELGQPFYRIEKFTRKTKNDGTLTGYPTASVFSSTMNSHVMDLYKRWGMRHSKVYYGFDGATAFTSALLNVNYMFGEDNSYDSSLYRLADSSGDIYLYENRQTLPFGYVAPSGYDLPEGYSMEGIKLQNRMVNELGVEDALFNQAGCDQDGDDVHLTVSQSGHYYMQLTASGTGKIEATGNFGTRNYNDLKNGSVLYLGYLKQGERVRLTNGDSEDESPKLALKAWVLDEEVLGQALEKLSQESLTHISYDSTHLSGEIRLQEEGRLILSIPYEDGWSVLVDGEKVKPELFGGVLMAFNLPAGRHEISMSYIPEGKYPGIAVSVVSVGIFVLLICLRRRKALVNSGKQSMAGSNTADGYNIEYDKEIDTEDIDNTRKDRMEESPEELMGHGEEE